MYKTQVTKVGEVGEGESMVFFVSSFLMYFFVTSSTALYHSLKCLSLLHMESNTSHCFIWYLL